MLVNICWFLSTISFVGKTYRKCHYLDFFFFFHLLFLLLFFFFSFFLHLPFLFIPSLPLLPPMVLVHRHCHHIRYHQCSRYHLWFFLFLLFLLFFIPLFLFLLFFIPLFLLLHHHCCHQYCGHHHHYCYYTSEVLAFKIVLDILILK